MYPSLLGLLGLLVTAALSSPPALGQVELSPSHPDTYTVKSGDTLWGIAGRFLKDPWRWPQLWEASRGIGNPDLIYPGDVLDLHYRHGQPRLARREGLRVVKVSPKVRITAMEEPIPTMPMGSISPFIARPYVLDKAQMDQAPYIVAFPGEHIVAGAGDLAYVRSIDGPVGRSYVIVRPGDAYLDPESGATLGYQALFVGEGILKRAGDPAKLKMVQMELEAGIGDRVLSSSKELPRSNFYPQPAPPGVQGRIISVLDGVSQIGQYDVVVLNVGAKKGVRPGHVFDVLNGGVKVRDIGKQDEFHKDWKTQRFWSEDTWYAPYRSDGWVPEGQPGPSFPMHAKLRKEVGTVVLPYERAGTLMIFRTFDRVSFGLIMSATRPISLLDVVRRPPA
jgi:hypothetical protein